MSINLLDLAKGQIGSMLAEKAAGFLGEDSGMTAKAVGAILPTLLGGALGKASTPDGASSLFGMLSDGNLDGSMLDNLSSVLGGGNATQMLQNSGGGIVSSLLGDKAGAIVNLISSFSGMRSGSANSLLSMAAPLVMGLIGKQVKSGGLDAGGLGKMLLGQAGFLKDALPAGMGSMLGIGNLLDSAPSAPKVTAPKIEMDAVPTNASFGRLFPWLAAAALLFGVLYYWNSCRKPAEIVENVGAVADTLTNAIAEAPAAIDGMLNKVLPGGGKIDFAANGIEQQLIAFIEDSNKVVNKEDWFSFDRLEFETGKSTLAASSNAQLDNIANILKAYPNVNLKIGGYTDNTGKKEANMKLSQERAETTMAAIISRGIDKGRLAAEGYGDQHPKASNDTEEGRQQNRRIDVRVTKK